MQVAFIRVGNLEEVQSGAVKVYSVLGREIMVCNVDGTLYAMDGLCTHEEEPLDQGFLDAYEIECPRHGACFDIRNGGVIEGPAVLPLDTFQIRLQDDIIEIDV